MKRTVILIALPLLFFASILLSGCSSGERQAPERIAPAANDEQTLSAPAPAPPPVPAPSPSPTMEAAPVLENASPSSDPQAPEPDYRRSETFTLNDANAWTADYWATVGMHTEDMKLSRSTDGGKTWTTVADTSVPGSTLPLGGTKVGFMFLTPVVGWLALNSPLDDTVQVYRTEDAGRSWSLEKLPVPDAAKRSNIQSSLPFFFNDKQGILTTIVINDAQPQLFYLTSDGGKTWNMHLNEHDGKTGNLSWTTQRRENAVGRVEFNYHVTVGEDSWVGNSGQTWITEDNKMR
ncbi:hypothetical protein GZH47_08575 [Paenibacillus rhizovicinus]|uniref:Photosynthesis system II assembly factor Ycf48/Hcf136-like domain-containing protein n=1 Tax=Paenibacillus rhizovicinus TaxID=2704463 RepID=A0A6C0NXN1_9BACL|nr:hypothetical protein [Paenibacillus rhizovicinus]QHW30901.1 hypothetical protein GZH47_08575 [Paenibacillus rhizovicinus]